MGRLARGELLLFLTAAAAAFVGAAVLSSPRRSGTPVAASQETGLIFRAPRHDAGVITDPRTAAVDHTFDFVNNGRSAVRILDARSTCGCTVVDLPRELIRPGDSGSVPVRMTLSSTGRISALVTIVSDAPNSPHRLEMDATYRPSQLLKVMPSLIRLGVVDQDIQDASVRLVVLHRETLPRDFLIDPVRYMEIACDGVAVGIVDWTVKHSPHRSVSGHYSTTVDARLSLAIPNAQGAFERVLHFKGTGPLADTACQATITGQRRKPS